MKFSNNTIVLTDYPNKDEYLLFNIRTQAMVKIGKELKETIDRFDEPNDFSRREKYSGDLVQLHKMGIIVANSEEDRQKLTSFLDQLKFGVKTSSFPVTILTTYACNLKCTYCYQESSRTYTKMDDRTGQHAMKWIKEKLLQFGYQQLYITFYGGEPLANKPMLEDIAAHMQSWCHEKNIQFKFMLQTNGYLMTPECIDQYLKLGLDQVRVSVDGVGERHDRNRPLRGGGGSFDQIIKNIVACVDQVKIGISTSYDKDDVDKIEELLDYFDDLGILHKLGRFIFSPIHSTLGPVGQPEKIRNPECMCNYQDKHLIQANTRIQKLMQDRGLTTKSGLSIAACPLTRANDGVTIDQQGKIYKCNSMLGHPEFAVGDVRHSDYNETNDKFVNLDVWRQCPVDCAYLPMCSGGCRLSSFFKKQNFTTPVCHKAYLIKMVPEFIKKEYELSLLH